MKFKIKRPQSFGQPVAATCADQRHNIRALRQHPGDGDLGDGGAFRLGDSPERLDEREVALDDSPR